MCRGFKFRGCIQRKYYKVDKFIIYPTKNNDYMRVLDVLKNIDDETIRVEVNGGQGPCIIKPVEGDKYIYLILPIRR